MREKSFVGFVFSLFLENLVLGLLVYCLDDYFGCLFFWLEVGIGIYVVILNVEMVM